MTLFQTFLAIHHQYRCHGGGTIKIKMCSVRCNPGATNHREWLKEMREKSLYSLILNDGVMSIRKKYNDDLARHAHLAYKISKRTANHII